LLFLIFADIEQAITTFWILPFWRAGNWTRVIVSFTSPRRCVRGAASIALTPTDSRPDWCDALRSLDDGDAARVLVPDVYTAKAALAAGNANHLPLEGLITAHDTILSEDPYVPVALGQVPVVADSFMLLRIGKRHPDAVQALIERIDAREFKFVILTAPSNKRRGGTHFISAATSFRH
jgi:hypothetical protein